MDAKRKVRLDNPAHLLLGASLSPSTTNHPDRPPQQRLSNGARHACAGSAAGFAGAEEAFCHASSDAEPRTAYVQRRRAELSAAGSLAP